MLACENSRSSRPRLPLHSLIGATWRFCTGGVLHAAQRAGCLHQCPLQHGWPVRCMQAPLHSGPINAIRLAKTRPAPMPTPAPCNVDDGKGVDAVTANISVRLVPLRVGGVLSVYTVTLPVSVSSGQYHASDHPFSHSFIYATNDTVPGKSLASQGHE